MSSFSQCKVATETCFNSFPGQIFPYAQRELDAFYKPWADYVAGNGPDPGRLPPDWTVGYSMIFPIALDASAPCGSPSNCVPETGVPEIDKSTIRSMAALIQSGLMLQYLIKNPSPAQLSYRICPDGRRVNRGTYESSVDPELAQCLDCGGVWSDGVGGGPTACSYPTKAPLSSPVTGYVVAAGVALAVIWVLKSRARSSR